MRTFITEQQAAFFTKNGYIEFEGLSFNTEEIFAAVSKNNYLTGRDLWRKNKILESLLLRTLAPVVIGLTGKRLRLACDQGIPFNPLLKTACSLKDLFSIQGLVLGAIFSSSNVELGARRAATVGIPPLPKQSSNVLFVKPMILLDWPLLAKSSPVSLYIVTYALPNAAVYVQNPNDPCTNFLKQFGYGFGDLLKDSTHPLCIK